jgi:hypothetical protein
MEDLWPKEIISESKVKSPGLLLKEQGSILAEKTKNIVSGQVGKVDVFPAEVGTFFYSFAIYSRTVRYYYELFRISHKILFYPVEFTIIDSDILKELGIESKQLPLKANNEEEFKGCLKKIFNATKTKNIISAILAQSEAGIT